MSDFTIKRKIAYLAVLPVLAIIILASILIAERYDQFSDASNMRMNGPALNSMTKLVGNLQKERGMSATFLSGGITISQLSSQRSETDSELVVFKKNFNASTYTDLKSIMSNIKEIDGLRSVVDRKGSIAEVLKGYTKVIYSLLNLYKVTASNTHLVDVIQALTNSLLVEEAKENAGKLRANLSKTLANDGPLDQSTFRTIVALKAGMDSSLVSPALVLDGKSQALITDLYTTRHYKKVNEVFKLVLSKMNEGKYGNNASDFFMTISKTVSHIGEIVAIQAQLLRDSVENAHKSAKRDLILLMVFIGAFLLGLVLFTLKLSVSINRPLKSLASALDRVSNQVNDSSGLLTEMSSNITNRATSQASAVEETSASVEELVGMVGIALESSEKSAGMTREIESVSKDGRDLADGLLNAMGEIKVSNESISQLVTLISEVGEKTKVIDEIVFQTKLLSFNASVEAGRAGEHGRGFAVVAQEVGNLAEMSGKAATEISKIVTKTVNDANAITKENSDKVDNGAKVAESAVSMFLQIEGNSVDAASESDNVFRASKEQNLGLSQINEAVTQLDKNTHENVQTSEEMSDASVNLQDLSNTLRGEISKLLSMVG